MIKPINNEYRADFDLLVDSFRVDLNLRTISTFPMISIYKSPKDYPRKYVARVFDIRPGEVHATRYVMISDDLEVLRAALPNGFSYIDKTPKDDPELVEVWF